MGAWWQSLRRTYLTVDTRSLAAFRVLFGLVLLSDLARRWAGLDFWYTNSGLLPNHTLLWRPPAPRMFSLFFTASTADEARIGLLLCAIVFSLFTLGYRTRWVQFLALIARVSLNSRLAVLENGGDMVMDLLCLLTLPLPLGARFSLDALAWRSRGNSPAAVEAGEWSRRPVLSIAVLALLLQFGAIYFFNAVSKNGAAWQDGSAVHYALHQDKLVTWLGVWMREQLPVPFIRALTWSTLATEWLGFALILSPVLVRQARLLAVCLMPALHAGFALGLNLGGFSPAMIAFFPLLLTAEHWEGLSRRFGQRWSSLGARLEPRLLPLGSRLPLFEPGIRAGFSRWLMEAGVVVLLLAIASEVVNDNASVPQALRVRQPAWAKALIEYPRILQGWRMFAAEPSREDSMIYVDAKTAAGTLVDPYNEVASDQSRPAGDVVPTHLGQTQFFVMYSDRIANANYVAYRTAFSEWLLAYPARTGRASDCLLSYDVYFVTDQSPDLGSQERPKPRERQRFMSYSAPLDGPCRPLAPSQPVRRQASRH